MSPKPRQQHVKLFSLADPCAAFRCILLTFRHLSAWAAMLPLPLLVTRDPPYFIAAQRLRTRVTPETLEST